MYAQRTKSSNLCRNWGGGASKKLGSSAMWQGTCILLHTGHPTEHSNVMRVFMRPGFVLAPPRLLFLRVYLLDKILVLPGHV